MDGLKMQTDVLLLNFSVVDFRRSDFDFVSELVSHGGIYCGTTGQMPGYSQEQYAQWTQHDQATAGGTANAAPLMAKVGLNVAIGANLGGGDFGGLDAQGRFFYDEMVRYGIDMSQTYIHPELPTATAFIHDVPQEDRKGIATFPNAINDFDFERFKKSVEKLNPKIVYYMYSGLSERGDANEGRDLAAFIKWCVGRGIVTIVDNHTLTDAPEDLIKIGGSVEKYKLLEPLLSEVDIFFTSSDESKLIGNTIFDQQEWYDFSGKDHTVFLETIAKKFWRKDKRTRLFGITVKDGAYQKHCLPDGSSIVPEKITSRFMAKGDINLVGAGDSFRSGVVSYIAYNMDGFIKGTIDFDEAIQMGSLFASIYIKNPLDDRFKGFGSFEKLLGVIKA
jgi:sugar/nucleoside kinase (ribokinase family)